MSAESHAELKASQRRLQRTADHHAAQIHAAHKLLTQAGIPYDAELTRRVEEVRDRGRRVLDLASGLHTIAVDLLEDIRDGGRPFVNPQQLEEIALEICRALLMDPKADMSEAVGASGKRIAGQPDIEPDLNLLTPVEQRFLFGDDDERC